MGFADTITRRMRELRSFACVGLDPVLERLPGALRDAHSDPSVAILAFSRGVVDVCAPLLPAIKFQSACYERHGWRGVRALEESISHARASGMVVVLDVKRGDIGISAEHYAASASSMGAHAVTLSGYMGPSTIQPYLDAGLGVFILVRTSNPDSDALQSLLLNDGRSVAEATADMTRAIALAHKGVAPGALVDVGAVVGATKSAEGASLRARMPDSIFLVPGYGAQGGTRHDVHAMLRANRRDAGDAGVLVTASRSVICAPEKDGSWRGGVEHAARAFVDELRTILA